MRPTHKKYLGRTLLLLLLFGAPSLLSTTTGLGEAWKGDDSFETDFKLAREADEQGKYSDAITRYQRLLRQNRADARVYSNLGLDYYRLNQFAEAAATLRDALKIQPELLGAQIFLGFSEFRLGQFQSSLRQLESALKAQPNDREIRTFLIQDQMALNRYDADLVNQTLRLFPTDAALNYTIGTAALERMRNIAHYANSLGQQSPIYQWIYLRQAEQRQDSGDVQKHREAIEKLGATTPPGLVRDYDELTSLVNRCFTTVLRTASESSYAHSVQGSIDEAQNLVSEALAEYRQAGNHFAAGRLLAQNLRLQEAEEELKASLHGDHENHLALADLAQVYVQEHEPAQALPLLQEILKFYPEDALAWADLGKAQLSVNENAAGVRSLRMAIKIDPSQTHLHYELAMAYRKLGEADLAERELAEFRKSSLAEHRN